MNELIKNVLTDDEATLREFAKRCAHTLGIFYVHDRGIDFDGELKAPPLEPEWEACAEKARVELAAIKAMTDEQKHTQWLECVNTIAQLDREGAETFNVRTVRLNRMQRRVLDWSHPDTQEMRNLKRTMVEQIAAARPEPRTPMTPPTLDAFYAGLVEAKQREVVYFENRARNAVERHERAAAFVKEFNEAFPPIGSASTSRLER